MAALPAHGTPSTEEYEFMTEARPASRMAAANGSAYTSRSSRGPRWTGAWFMPPSERP
jgi:hypothetical protein